MNRRISLSVFALSLLLFSCGEKDELSEKKQLLSEKKEELQALKAEVSELEAEIAVLDPSFNAQVREAQLVSTLPVELETFRHFVEVAGDVQSEKNVLLGAEMMGTVEDIAAEEGQQVRKGELLVRINADIIRNNISEVQTQLDLATAVFERQKNLWDQKIGTEVQFLKAKADMEALQNRLNSLKAQLAQAQQVAPFSGTIEEVMVREGETVSPGTPLVRLVSLEDMYIRADVSEAYIGQFSEGDNVEIYFPSLDKNYQTSITAVGQVINPDNRTFTIEARLPEDKKLLKPNLLAVLKVKDFEQEGGIVIPTHLIQRDRKGEYVYVVAEKDGVPVVEKKHIETGMSYNNETLVRSGLEATDVLVNEGFREVSEGVNVKVVNKTVAAN
ncbi:efflux RND transporter periplasmic adaptor subunit [Nafulsella turpanensis]|uniref:efflux RND transporter periplasmic adaptor subunit n=1 Tax=Nafulsella turpanensis TaxID=1265690 RepID=UPI000349D729|nr:efflux RND transporter periplasmic adaptor subunit [Nafulsella turpanensis]